MSRFLPSDFLPDFFRMDLAVGLDNQNALISALDEACESYGVLAHKLASSLYAGHENENWIKQNLTYLGFRFSTLSLFSTPLNAAKILLEKIHLLELAGC